MKRTTKKTEEKVEVAPQEEPNEPAQKTVQESPSEEAPSQPVQDVQPEQPLAEEQPLEESEAEPAPQEEDAPQEAQEGGETPAEAEPQAEGEAQEGSSDEGEGSEPCQDGETDVPPAEEQSTGKGKRRRKKRIKIYERTLDQDIKFRGFLSYRILRILAWVALWCAQAAIFVSLGVRFDAKFASQWSGVLAFLQTAGPLMTPLFMIATFATILNGKRDIRRILLLYAVFSVAVLLLFFLLHDHVMVGLYKKWMGLSRADALKAVDNLLRTLPADRYIAFNIFFDLFLCTLFTFFLVYQPKLKVFQGKMVIMFRLLALLPVMCEIISFVLKVGAYSQTLTLSPYVYPFLTTKPPLTFVIFVAMAFFIKFRERLFTRKGRSKEDYAAFINTNVNSLHFSIFASITIVVAVVLDFILLFIVGVATLKYFPAETMEDSLMQAITSARHVGLGETAPMLILIPVVMFFSYTRSHKNSTFDLILPWFGIIGVGLVWLEGLYQLLLRAPDLLGKFIGA